MSGEKNACLSILHVQKYLIMMIISNRFFYLLFYKHVREVVKITRKSTHRDALVLLDYVELGKLSKKGLFTVRLTVRVDPTLPP